MSSNYNNIILNKTKKRKIKDEIVWKRKCVSGCWESAVLADTVVKG